MSGEILVVPFFGQGHLYPCIELCCHIASRNLNATLVITSDLSSSIPSSLRQHHLVQIVEIPSSPAPPPQPGSDPLHHHHHHHNQMAQGLEKLLSVSKPLCAIIDMLMGWSTDIFRKSEVPTIGFSTSGACSAAMEYAMWKAHTDDLKPDEIRLLPGLPEEMAVTPSDLKRRARGPPRGNGGDFQKPPGVLGPKKMGPPKPGDAPPWLTEMGDSIALMINTCDDLEHPFLEYLAHQMGKPVWGVGPLLPAQYWKSSGSLIHDKEIRTNRPSNVTEDEVIEWLDSKPKGSVLYVSFGSEVGPTMEEYSELASALEESSRPFIWVIQPNSGKSGPPRPPGSNESGERGYSPKELIGKVGSRGMIIQGWAPQLLILSHKSTGGFLSHCGWNSTVEGLGRGVPFLAWPIRGDQYNNAKLLVKHLKVGYMVSEQIWEMVKKEDIGKGIERLMGDEEIKERAAKVGSKLEHGFPKTSVASLDAFADFIKPKM